MNRRLTTLAIAAIALLGLTGCAQTLVPVESAGSDTSASASAAPEASDAASDAPTDDAASDGGGQTVAEACEIVNSSVNDAMVGLQDVGASTDPQASIDALTAAGDAIGAAAGEIDNPEVVAAATGLQGTFTKFAEVARSALVDGDTSQAAEIPALTEELQTSVTAFYTLCTP